MGEEDIVTHVLVDEETWCLEEGMVTHGFWLMRKCGVLEKALSRAALVDEETWCLGKGMVTHGFG